MSTPINDEELQDWRQLWRDRWQPVIDMLRREFGLTRSEAIFMMSAQWSARSCAEIIRYFEAVKLTAKKYDRIADEQLKDIDDDWKT